jgi:branched-chain amino acid transport system permease protein
MAVVQTLIDALGLGAVYALVAIGIALVFGVMRLVNFAYGELITAGAYALALTSSWPRVGSVLLCFAVSITLALLQERIAFRPLRNASPITMLVATFAVSFGLQAVALLQFGSQGNFVSTFAQLNETVSSGRLQVRWVSVLAIGLGVALLAATALILNRTNIGLQMRAAAHDFRTARILGVRADRVISSAFLLSGFLAAVVAIVLTIQTPLVQPQFGLQITILALVGVVVGGIDRLTTATLGGFAVGFATSVLGDRLPSATSTYLPSFVYLLVILVLLVRPNGLFTPLRRSTVERV